jgi:hypothetical protein
MRRSARAGLGGTRTAVCSLVWKTCRWAWRTTSASTRASGPSATRCQRQWGQCTRNVWAAGTSAVLAAERYQQSRF